jgi:glycosyltransferase involved in cell wall biosynthesis
MSHRVALLVPDFEDDGGVKQVALFLHRVLRETDRYEPDVLSLALSARDPASIRVAAPSTWSRGVRVQERTAAEGIPYRHVGAVGAEFEFQRYRPRPALTQLLASYDLIQVVAGTPPWAHVAKHADAPIALQVATLTDVERGGQDGKETLLPLRLWRAGMTRIASWMERAVPSFVDAVFVENSWMHDHFQSIPGNHSVYFAPPGIDTSVFHPRDASSEPGAYILSVGRLGDSRKNVRLLFEAYARLRKREERDIPRLVLAGLSGPTERDWKYAGALGIRDDVEMRTNVPRDELARLYRHARLFVLSSNEEGLGLVLAEAMASGVPVVSTDCGGPSTLIDDGTTGFLVPTEDAAALADRMAHILQHPDEAANMGQAGRIRVVQEFSEAAAGKRFVRVYDDLVSD